MYKQHCILTLNQDTHVLAARHMHIDGLNGTNSYTASQQLFSQIMLQTSSAKSAAADHLPRPAEYAELAPQNPHVCHFLFPWKASTHLVIT